MTCVKKSAVCRKNAGTQALRASEKVSIVVGSKGFLQSFR